MEPKVSIVIPVYNVEKYIARCLDSIFAQTYTNTELIVVVDGSPDDSISIIRSYEKDHDFQVYVTENHGLSGARNFGLSKATGDYVIFIDSDDYVKDTMVERLVHCALEGNHELVVSDYYKVYVEREEAVSLGIQESDTVDERVIKAKPYAWNKLYKRDLFERFGLQFPERLIFEDIPTTYPMMMQLSSIGYVNEPLYYYIFDRGDSIMNTKSRKDLVMFEVLKRLNEYGVSHHLMEAHRQTFMELTTRHIFYRLRDPRARANKECANEFTDLGFKYLNETFPNWKTDAPYAQAMAWYKKTKLFWKLRILLGK